MELTEYAKDIRRLGSKKPFVKEDGTRMNLVAGISFEPGAVCTDGVGNIIDMPLCRRKWCFGRPERYLRGAEDLARAPYTNGNTSDHWQLSKCQRCAVTVDCAEVVMERIESDKGIEDSFHRWDDQTAAMPANDKFDGPGRRRWSAFLHAIERHGGWTSVNDGRVAADDAARRAAKQVSDRKAKADQQAHRRGPPRAESQPLTPAFFAAVDAERNRRNKILLDLNQQSKAPKWINRLSPDGCERTADVWMAKVLLERASRRVTGTAIAEWLVRNGKDQGRPLNTLTTQVYNDLRRIKKLETPQPSGSIWALMNPVA